MEAVGLGLCEIIQRDAENVTSLDDAISIGLEAVRGEQLQRWRYAAIASKFDPQQRKEFAKNINVGQTYIYDCVQVFTFYGLPTIARYYDGEEHVNWSAYLKVMRAVRGKPENKGKSIEELRALAVDYIEQYVIPDMQTPEETTRQLAATFGDKKLTGTCVILGYQDGRMVLSVPPTLVGVEVGTAYHFRLTPASTEETE